VPLAPLVRNVVIGELALTKYRYALELTFEIVAHLLDFRNSCTSFYATAVEKLHMSKADENAEYIFVASFRHPKTGKRIYASQSGKKAFRLKIKKTK